MKIHDLALTADLVDRANRSDLLLPSTDSACAGSNRPVGTGDMREATELPSVAPSLLSDKTPSISSYRLRFSGLFMSMSTDPAMPKLSMFIFLTSCVT